MFKKECCECGRVMMLKESDGWTEERAKCSQVICDECDEALADIDEMMDNLGEIEDEYLQGLERKRLQRQKELILSEIKKRPMKL